MKGLADNSMLSHFRIVRKIGEGGMGEVYLAEDVKLGRRVAIKILPEDVAGSSERIGRFEQEARAVSALNHPNILTVYNFEQADAFCFMVTEFVEGETLRDRIDRGIFDTHEAVSVVEQIASALSAAHSAGVTHRDIKPANIILRPDGIVKVLDFGLAKLEMTAGIPDQDAPTRKLVKTRSGVITGTIHYMSPEQARGLVTDSRTDIWSLGVVMFEMLTGSLPFEGESDGDYLASLIRSDPRTTDLGKLTGESAENVSRVVRKMLRKYPDERYQTMKGLLSDLREIQGEAEFSKRGGRQDVIPTNAENGRATRLRVLPENASVPGGRKPILFVALFLGSLIAAAAAGYWIFFAPDSAVGQIRSLAVMPFINESGSADVEYLSDGMTETLINSLSKIPDLNVKARSTVFHYKGREIEPVSVGRELSVNALLNGRVVQRGEDLVLYLSLVDTQTGDQIWGESYDRKLTDLVSLQKEITQDVSEKLKVRLSGVDEQRVTKNYTENPEAYQLYLRGRHHLLKTTSADIEKAIMYFQQAIDIDPGYALAYVWLADAYRAPAYEREPGDILPKAKAAARKAIELDPNLADAHAVMGFIIFWYDWDWNDAENEFKRALELDPNCAEAHLFYAHLLSNLGKHDEALAEAKRARELDPLNVRTNALEGQFLTHAGRPDEALERFRATLELDPNNWMAHLFMSSTYIEKHMYPEAIAAGQKAINVHQQARSISYLAYALAKNGQRREAEAELAKLLEAQKHRWTSPYSIAMIYQGLGEKEQALRWLEQAYEQRDPRMVFLHIEPKWSGLRQEPRFRALLDKMKFPY